MPLEQIAGGLIGIGLGQLGQNQQMENQQALMQQQLANQQTLNIQGGEIARQNWDYTNYENQRKHMEKAGLNVGLMYGQGGGGGATLSSGSGGSASSGNAPDSGMAMALQGANIASQTRLNEAQDKKIESETPTSGNTGDTNIENVNTNTGKLREEGIGKMQENAIRQWMMDDPSKRGQYEYNDKLDYHTQIGQDSQQSKQIELALFKTAAETTGLEANALLNNAKAQGYWKELLNATKNADSEAIKAAAQKLSSEWNTGEYTNWKTWTDLGLKAIGSASDLIKGSKYVPISKTNKQ